MSGTSLAWVKERAVVTFSNLSADGSGVGRLKILDKDGQLNVGSGGGRQSQWIVEVVESGAGEGDAPPKVRLKSRFNGKYLRVKEKSFKGEASGTLSDKVPEASIFSVIPDGAVKFANKAAFQLQCQAYNQEKYVGSVPAQSGTGGTSPARSVVATVPGDGTYWVVKQT